MKRGIVIGISILVLIVAGYFVFFNQSGDVGTNEVPGSETSEFGNPVKTPHYESNVPVHGQVLAGVPINIVINFNFDLHEISEIKILKDGNDYGMGNSEVDENKLTLRRAMKIDSPDGIYTVEYSACWPDQSCHDGEFKFEIDSDKATEFLDMSGNSEVNINIENLEFSPQKIIIDKGAKVIWNNKDNVIHYVNSNPHGAHSYFHEQNSQAIMPGNSFELTFDAEGIYPYHCSAHSFMTGEILVQ